MKPTDRFLNNMMECQVKVSKHIYRSDSIRVDGTKSESAFSAKVENDLKWSCDQNPKSKLIESLNWSNDKSLFSITAIKKHADRHIKLLLLI